MNKEFAVYGEIRVPVCFFTKSSSAEGALQIIDEKFNRRSLLVLDGDINLVSGASHPILAQHCSFNWFEAIEK